MVTRDAVVLAPGLLGFSRLGGFYYFADRVVATLRGLLEEALRRAVPVVPCTTLPTSSLAARQAFLVSYLERLCARLEGVERLHLVGHSTGGVDVELLACTTRLDGTAWATSEQLVRARIASVVTISAPHHGTGLADSRLASFGANPLLDPGAIVPLARVLADLIALLPREIAAAAGFAVARPNDVLRFLLQVVESRDLIGDLKPAHMDALRARVKQEASIPVTAIVTGTAPRYGGARPSDPFFVDLYGMTATAAASPSPAVEACRRRLERALEVEPELLVASRTAEVPRQVDVALNDGIVNSARQLVDEHTRIGAIVLADHGDVLGHYDRQDDLIDGTPLNAGLFHSGAGFGDDQFFELYRRVACAILRAVPGAAASEMRSAG
jgi:pimeloyl-ACP methyl ester carboxylesterase